MTHNELTCSVKGCGHCDNTAARLLTKSTHHSEVEGLVERQNKAKAALILTPLIRQIFHGENSTSEQIHKELDIALDALTKLITTHSAKEREEVLNEIDRRAGTSPFQSGSSTEWDRGVRFQWQGIKNAIKELRALPQTDVTKN